MIYIYSYKAEANEKKKSLPYIQASLDKWMKDLGGQVTAGEIEVYKDDKGKPHTTDAGVFVSASHSGEYVICGISSEPLGVDIQEQKDKIRYKRIAKRFFTEEENKLIDREGPEVFFCMWSIKEAFAKLDGRGLGYGLNHIQTVDGDALAAHIEGVRVRYEIRGDMCFACVGGEGDLVWIEAEL